MFQKRLTWFWIMLTTLAIIIVGRLVQLQVVYADEYHALAERILTRQPDYITAPRGTIHDRNRIPLVSDEPASDVCIHYALLDDDPINRRNYLIDIAPRPAPARRLSGRLPPL